MINKILIHVELLEGEPGDGSTIPTGEIEVTDMSDLADMVDYCVTLEKGNNYRILDCMGVIYKATLITDILGTHIYTTGNKQEAGAVKVNPVALPEGMKVFEYMRPVTKKEFVGWVEKDLLADRPDPLDATMYFKMNDAEVYRNTTENPFSDAREFVWYADAPKEDLATYLGIDTGPPSFYIPVSRFFHMRKYLMFMASIR